MCCFIIRNTARKYTHSYWKKLHTWPKLTQAPEQLVMTIAKRDFRAWSVTDHFTKMLSTLWFYYNQCGWTVWHPYISVLIKYSRPQKLPQQSPKPRQSSNSKCLVTVNVPLTHTCIQANNTNCTKNAKFINAVQGKWVHYNQL